MLKVLLVEDHEESRYLLRVLLEGSGYQVSAAAHGAEALEMAYADPPDIVIADILMPVMDGFTLCRHWKRDERLKDIPFIFYTATYKDPKDQQLGLDLGADRFIVKPTEPEAFLKILTGIIAEREAGRLVAARPPVEEETVYLKEYNEALIRKLEDKLGELDRGRQELLAEAAARIQAEEVLRKSVEELRVHNRIAGVLLTAHGDDMFDQVLQVVLEWVGSPVGLFGYIDESGALVCPSLTGSVWDRCQIPGKRNVFPRESWGGLFGQALRQKKLLYSNGPLRAPEGHIPLERAVCAPLVYRGELVGMIAVANRATGYDETDRVRMESVGGFVTPVLHARLARDRAEKDRMRLEEQFREAQKLESVGRLAGGLAHDFNNLLTVVLGHAQLMLHRLPAGAPERSGLQEIVTAAERAVHLTGQLLAFSRRQVIQPRVFDLNLRIMRLEQMLGRLIGEDIELQIHPGSERAAVHADPAQVEQVLMNLAVNSRDAMPLGGRIVIRTADVDIDEARAGEHGVAPGPYVMLAVSDTGSGMDAAVRSRIFEPFFTTKEVGKGTGLGLATVYGIVRQSGGYVTVDSWPGAGATFEVYLPAARETVEPSAPPAAPGAAPRGSETILLVEDETGVRDLILMVLEDHGYKVLEARDPAQAVQVSEGFAEPIHLLLTDVVMPGMRGEELAQRLGLRRPDMRVLYMSGYAEGAIVQDTVLRPRPAFLAKPFEPDTLVQRVREVLDAPPPGPS